MLDAAKKRRSLRRAVLVECTVGNDGWDRSMGLRASDVSNDGLWIDTCFPLELGQELVLSFAPPGAAWHEEVWAVGEVARVGLWRRESDLWATGMGIAFTYLNAFDRRFLTNALIGHPPRLPGRKKPPPLPGTRAATSLPPPLPLSRELPRDMAPPVMTEPLRWGQRDLLDLG